jgi:hypothetical protein
VVNGVVVVDSEGLFGSISGFIFGMYYRVSLKDSNYSVYLGIFMIQMGLQGTRMISILNICDVRF